MAVAQSLALVITVRFLLHIEAADLVGLTALVILASMTFVAINQSLAALLGTPGRFLCLVLIVIQLAASGGTYPVETAPGFFQSLHPYLPLTHAVNAFRDLINGGNLYLAQGVGVQVVWLAGSLVLLCVASRRTQPEAPVGVPVDTPASVVAR